MPTPGVDLLVRLRSSRPRDEVVGVMKERMPEFRASIGEAYGVEGEPRVEVYSVLTPLREEDG